MVQAARLDLIRPLAVAGLVLSIAGGVRAQPLLSNPSLTTLMQPQRLDRSRPLMPSAPLSGTSEVGPGGMPCARSGAAGPARGPGQAAAGAPGSTASGVDRPLYGGTDRPLWSTGPAAPGKTVTAGPNATAGGTRPRDRPLWAEGPQASAAAAADSPAVDLALPPCSPVDPPLSR